MADTLAFLYIEDDEMSRQIMSFYMAEVLGYKQITVWEDSAALCERLDQLATVPNVVFLDIHLTPLNGFEILKELRRRAEYKTVPIIALTASVMNEEIRMLKQAGFNGAIAKPINMDTFPDVLTHILNGESVWRVF
jgi:CheY-like chemotaxis protein